MRIYLDGVFDLYHRGHLESFKYLKSEEFHKRVNSKNIVLIVGIVSDSDAEGYKRKPIINEENRVEILKYNKLIDEVIFPCPLVIDKEFIDKNNIDYVVHGFADESDFDKQTEFFKIPIELKKFLKINYYSKTSTSDIIRKIKSLN